MMAEPVDLFGEPYLRRSADFPYHRIRRRLTRWWAPGPRPLVIGCNPSDADAYREDMTTHWLNAWFQLYGYPGYDLMNLYPFCTSSPAECREIVDRGYLGDWASLDAMRYLNEPALVKAAKAAPQVFVCWGAIAWDDTYVEHMIEQIQNDAEPWPDLWCWGKTGSGAPKHPLARGRHRIPKDQAPILWRAADA